MEISYSHARKYAMEYLLSNYIQNSKFLKPTIIHNNTICIYIYIYIYINFKQNHNILACNFTENGPLCSYFSRILTARVRTPIFQSRFQRLQLNFSSYNPGASSAVLLKKTPTQLFSCKYCEILKNNYFEELL